jgi:hypothetical protein
MTNDEYELTADVLRRRVNAITKMFEEPGARVPEAEVPRAMKVQVLVLAQELEFAFYQRDPALKENIFVGAVQDEMKRNVTTPTEFTLGWASGEPRHR